MSNAAIGATLDRLNADAEKIRNTEPQDLSTMEVGDEFRQGDQRIIRLPDDFVKRNARNLTLIEKPGAQIAPGTTQGSRHVMGSMAGVTMYRMKDATPIDGPIITLDTPNSITHPEHGDCVNIPAGCYATPGQRAFAEELRRTLD